MPPYFVDLTTQGIKAIGAVGRAVAEFEKGFTEVEKRLLTPFEKEWRNLFLATQSGMKKFISQMCSMKNGDGCGATTE
jgi:hypothetical protein